MSVNVEIYCLVGVLLPTAALKGELDQLEPYMDGDGKDGLRVIYDGMNGDYLAVGRVVGKGNDSDGHLDHPVIFEHLSSEEVVDLWIKIAALVSSKVEVPAIRCLVISHYH